MEEKRSLNTLLAEFDVMWDDTIGKMWIKPVPADDSISAKMHTLKTKLSDEHQELMAASEKQRAVAERLEPKVDSIRPGSDMADFSRSTFSEMAEAHHNLSLFNETAAGERLTKLARLAVLEKEINKALPKPDATGPRNNWPSP